MSLRVAVAVMFVATLSAAAAGARSDCAVPEAGAPPAPIAAEESPSAAYEFAPDFRSADLRGADLRARDFHRADLRGANLAKADLRGADLRLALIDGTDLRGADLRGARFARSHVIAADRAKFAGAVIDETTVLPFRCSEAAKLGIVIVKSGHGPASIDSDGVTRCAPAKELISLSAE